MLIFERKVTRKKIEEEGVGFKISVTRSQKILEKSVEIFLEDTLT
jgi:uncharacterized UPF0146 family protein